MDKEKISVIVPIYNVEMYLRQCLDSIIKQTYNNLEILLINDGSTDKSLFICKEYEKIDNRIKVIDKENGGVSSARNVGIEKSTGEWICFIDPDDWVEKNMIEKLLINAKKYKADIIQGNCYYNKGDKQWKREAITPKVIKKINEEIELFQLGIICNIYAKKKNGISLGPIRGVWGKLYKKEIIKDLKFNQDLYMFEDGLFNLYAFDKAKTVVVFNFYMYHYRLNQNSACNKYKSTWTKQAEQIIIETKKFIEIKRDNKFNKVYNAIVCEMFTSSLTRSIFHKDNGKTKKEEKNILKSYINNSIYEKAFESIDFKYLNKKQKLIIFLAKYKAVNSIYYIYQIKNKINK